MSNRSSPHSLKSTVTAALGAAALSEGAKQFAPNKDLMSVASGSYPTNASNETAARTDSSETVSLIRSPESIPASTMNALDTAAGRVDGPPTVPTITPSTAAGTITDPKGLQGHELTAISPEVQATSANNDPEVSTSSLPGTPSNSATVPIASPNAANGGPRPPRLFGGRH